MTQNADEIRAKIMNILRSKGPSLPIHISKETGLSVLFASAFLSELLGTKEIKISDMKVGGSPLYFTPGSEEKLENYSNYLKGKEKEAYLMLKENKILDDMKLEPAIRVALRQIKDFAIPLPAKDNEKQMLFWRYFTLPEEEAKKMIQEKYEPTAPATTSPSPLPVQTPSPNLPVKQPIVSEPVIRKDSIKEKAINVDVAVQKEAKKEKPKEKSDFVLAALKALQNENIELLEEKEIKKKEFSAVVRIDSNIGKLRFLMICKDKKKISDNDLSLAMQHSHSFNLPIILAYTGETDKKAEKLLEQYSGMIKLKKISI